MKRIITLILAALMIVGVSMIAVSCGEEKTPAGTTAAPTATTTANEPAATKENTSGGTPVSTTEQTAEATTGGTTQATPTETTSGGGTTPSGDGYSKPDMFLDIDFGGRTFSFVTTNDDDEDRQTSKEIAVESRTGGTVVQTAVYDRNQVLKRLYNCELQAVKGPLSLIENDVNSGTNEYDFGSAEYLWFMSNKGGYYTNVYDLDLNMDIEGWNKTLFDQCTVRDKNGKDKLYIFDADFNFETFRCTWALHCNLGLYNQNFSESIFDIVRNKEWTIDKMMEMVSAVAQDNGDQKWTPGEDIYGLMTTSHNAFGLITSTGVRTVFFDENHNMSTSVDQILSNNAINAIDKCAELCAMDGVSIGGYTVNQTAYLAGKTLFMGELLCFADRVSSEATIDLNTTIIPEPLYSSETQDKYTTYVNNKGSTFVVSKNACGGDKKMTADFLNVLVYHSHKIVYPEFLLFYGQICCNDENTPEMIDIIVNGLTYDYSYYGAGGTVMGQLAEMIHTGKNQLNRAANSLQRTLQNAINTYVDDMTASE